MRVRLLASGLVVALISGAVIARSTRAVGAQGGQRLRLIQVGNEMAFISDSKSAGCWLAILGSGGSGFDAVVGIAPAPVDACK